MLLHPLRDLDHPQLQLLLNRQQWPEGLVAQDGPARSRKSNMLTQALHGAARVFKRDPSARVSERVSPELGGPESLSKAQGSTFPFNFSTSGPLASVKEVSPRPGGGFSLASLQAALGSLSGPTGTPRGGALPEDTAGGWASF